MAAVPSIGRATGVELPHAAPAAAAHGLYHRHYSRVLGFCRNRLRTREEAEDAAQTTFCYALGALRRGVVPASESAWLLKIARNVCLNRWDANRRRKLVEVARDPQVLQEVAPAREADDGERLALEDALGQLTELQRRAIVLREWQGLSYGEIADELGLSRAAVETLIFRARRSLARHLRGDRRLRSGLDLGSILTGLKSLLTGGGAAIKVAAAVIALATAGAIAEPQLQHALTRRAGSAPASSPRVSKPDSSPALSHSRVLAPAAARIRETSEPAQGVAPVTDESPRRASPPADTPTPANAGPASPAASGPTATEAPSATSGIQPPAAPAPLVPPSTPEIPSTDATAPALPAAPSAPALPPAPTLPPVPPVPTVTVPDVPTVPTPTVSAPSTPLPLP